MISTGLNYRSPNVSSIDSDPGGVEKLARPDRVGEGEIPEVGSRVGLGHAVGGEVISRTRYPRGFYCIGHFWDAHEAMAARRMIDCRRLCCLLERRADGPVVPELGDVDIDVPALVGEIPIDVDGGVIADIQACKAEFGSKRPRSVDVVEPVLRLRRRRYVSVEVVEAAVRQGLTEPDGLGGSTSSGAVVVERPGRVLWSNRDDVAVAEDLAEALTEEQNEAVESVCRLFRVGDVIE